MPNISSLLNMGQTSLLSNQSNIHITGNNIANVDTPGYSRQTPRIIERPGLNVAPGQIGQGAWTQDVLRHFDYFVERSYLQKHSAESRYKSEYGHLQSIESVFNEANSKGISSLLSKFLGSWNALVSTPESQPVRETIVSAGQNFASTIRQTEEYLSNYQNRLDTLINQDVESVNRILKQIADLNKQINIYDDPGNNNANVLLDQRDQLSRELSNYIDVDISNNGRGDYTIYTKAGHTLVENNTSFSLAFEGPKATSFPKSTSTYNGTAGFSGESYREYTVEFVTADTVASGNAKYRVSLDGGATWIKDETGADVLYTATNSSDITDVKGLGIYFDGSGSFAAGDRFEIVPKSALYWVTPTTNPLNISPQLLGNGSENSSRISGGTLAANLYVRDYDLGSYREQLDSFAKSVIWEVNREHSQGVGLIKNDYMQGTYRVQDVNVPLGGNTSGLAFNDRLQSGNVMFYIYDSATGKIVDAPNTYGPLDFRSVTPASPNFDPAIHSLENVKDVINASYGTYLNATIQDNRLVIDSRSADYQFAVGGDTSGLLAALGLNTYFTGNGSADIGINETVVQDHRKLCAGAINGGFEGNAGDSDVARALSELGTKKVRIPGLGMNQDTTGTLLGYYGTLVSNVGSDTAKSKFSYHYESALASDLDARQAETAGVNLDEELTLLIRYQNSYKAAAKLITTADQMFQTLLGIKQ